MFVFDEKLYLYAKYLGEKLKFTVQVAHEQRKFEIIHMLCRYNYTSCSMRRARHGPIRTVLTDVTKHAQPKNRNCIKMLTQSLINQEIIT